MVDVFREVRRVLHPSGLAFVNLGDCYAGTGKTGGGQQGSRAEEYRAISPTGIGTFHAAPRGMDGQLLNMPHRVAEALRANGWLWRQTIVWAKPSPMPESVNGWRWVRCRVKVASGDYGEQVRPRDGANRDGHLGGEQGRSTWQDCPGCPKCIPNGGYVLRKGKGRCTTAHEYLFVLAKGPGYFWDSAAFVEKAGTQGPRPFGGTSQARKNGDRSDYAYSGDNGTRNPRSVWTISPEPTGSYEIDRWVRVALGDASGDIVRIESPDCPVHGCLDHRHDEPQDDSLNRNPHTDCRHDQGQPLVQSDDPSHHATSSLTDGPDERRREHCSSAIEHSSQTRRTDHDPETSPSCTPCEQNATRTDGKQAQHESPANHHGTSGCNTLPDGCPSEQTTDCIGGTPAPDARQVADERRDGAQRTESNKTSSLPAEMGLLEMGRTPHHIVDKSALDISPECSCALYHKVTGKSSHFASYPSELVRRCIQAGTSNGGCCPDCGMPWAPVVDSTTIRRERPSDKTGRHHEGNGVNSCGNTVAGVENRILGYRPTCNCNQPSVPCTVLEPFAGTGTTLQVARAMGRAAVGIELSPDYCEIAGRKIPTEPRCMKPKKAKPTKALKRRESYPLFDAA